MVIEKTCLNPDCGVVFLAKRRDKQCCSTQCYSHFYAITHTEEIKAYFKKFYTDNHERELARSLAYGASHREEALQAYRTRMETDPEKVREIRRRSAKKTRAEDPEKHRSYKEAYRAANRELYRLAEAKRRAAKANAEINDLTTAQWHEICAIFRYCCAYCGQKPDMLTLDHITPLSKKGNHTASNVIPACLSCNSSKNARAAPKPIQPMLLTLAPPKPKNLLISKTILLK